jgi:cell division protein FtsQ
MSTSTPPSFAPSGRGALARFAIVMAALCAAAALPQSSLFSIERIDVAGTSALDAATVRALSGLAPGQRLFAVDAAAVAARLAAHPRIKTAVLRVRPPHAIAITVVERRPVMALAVDEGFALVDEELVVVDARPDPGDLVRVIVRTGMPGWPRPGTRIAADLGRAVLDAQAAPPAAMAADVAEIVVSPGPDLTYVMRSGLRVRAGGPAGLAARLAQVPGLLDALRARHLGVASIDLRYAGSIVVKPVAGGEVR